MKPETRHYLLLLALAAYALFFTNLFRFDLIYSAYTDNFTMYYLAGLRDAALFPGDAIMDIMFRNMYNPAMREFLFGTFYRVLLQVIPLTAAVKVAAFMLVSLSAFLVYRIGRILFGTPPKALFLGVAFLACFLSMDSFYYGQNRSFGVSLFVLLAYALVSGRRLLIPPLIYLFYVFYPYLALPAGLISAALVPGLTAEGSYRVKYLLLLLASVALCAATDISLAASADQAAAWGSKFSASGGGLSPLRSLIVFTLNLGEHSRLYPLVLLVFSATTAAAFFSRGAAAFSPLRGRGLWPLLLFPLAFAALYPLNPLYASRQLVFFLPLALTFAFSAGVFCLLPEYRPGQLAVLLAALFAAAHPFLNDIDDFSTYRGLYSHVASLPAGARVAAPPYSRAAAGLPFFAGRPVVYSDAMAKVSALSRPAADRKGELKALLSAICSADPAEAARFSTENGVTHFLVEPDFHRPGGSCGARGSALYAAAVESPGVFRTRASGRDIYLLEAGELAARGR